MLAWRTVALVANQVKSVHDLHGHLVPIPLYGSWYRGGWCPRHRETKRFAVHVPFRFVRPNVVAYATCPRCGEIVSSTCAGKDAESILMTLAGYGQDICVWTVGIRRERKPRLELLRDVQFESINTNLLDIRIAWYEAWKEGYGPGTVKRCRLGAVHPRTQHLGSCVPSVNGAGDGIRTHDFNLGKVALYP